MHAQCVNILGHFSNWRPITSSYAFEDGALAIQSEPPRSSISGGGARGLVGIAQGSFADLSVGEFRLGFQCEAEWCILR